MVEQTYSVDMVRLERKVPALEFQTWMDERPTQHNAEIKYFPGFSHVQYKHLWRVSENGPLGVPFSWAMMFHHGAEKAGIRHNLVIEYNPSKCPPVGFLNEVLRRWVTNDTLLKRIDLAIDMPVHIDSFFWLSTGKQKVRMFDSSIGKTWYFGDRGNGQVKLYNKAAELGKPEDVLTRLEKTIVIDKPLSHVVFTTLKRSLGRNFSSRSP